jgi:hypothetical protein
LTLFQFKLAYQQLVSVPPSSTRSLLPPPNTGPSKVLASKVPAAGKPVGSSMAVPPSSSHSSTISSISSNTYNLAFDGKTYPIKYQISGTNNKLSSITTSPASSATAKKANSPTALSVSVFSPSNGRLTIDIPRTVIDSKKPGTNSDNPYIVFIDKTYNPSFKETAKNVLSRTLLLILSKVLNE